MNNDIMKVTDNIDMNDIERINYENIDYTQIMNFGSATLKEFADACEKFRISRGVNSSAIDEKEYLDLIDKLDIDIYFEQYDKELKKVKDKINKKNKIVSSNNPFLAVIAGLNKTLNKLFPEVEPEIESFSDVEEKYIENIDELVIKTQEKLNTLTIEANENNEIKQILLMLNEKLEKTIDLAKKDLANYQVCVIDPLEAKTRNDDEENTYKIAITVKNVVQSKINDLKDSLLLNKDTLLKRDLLNFNNVPLASMYNKFIDTISNSLKMKARTAIDIKIQQERIAAQHLLNDKINESLVKQSENVNENIKESSRLIAEGTIKEETYKKIANTATEARKLLMDCQKQAVANIALKTEILENTEAVFDQNYSEVQRVLFDSSADNSTLNLEPGKGLVKK